MFIINTFFVRFIFYFAIVYLFGGSNLKFKYLDMPNRPHLRLNTQQQSDQSVRLRFNYGFGIQDEPDPEFVARSLRRQAQEFQVQVRSFAIAKQQRAERRTLEVPAHIINIRIQFHGQFNIPRYFNAWYNDFGLVAVNYAQYNTEVLFSVWDEVRFTHFLEQINNFVGRELDGNQTINYDGKVRYIKSFTLLSSADILQTNSESTMYIIELLEFPLPEPAQTAISDSLLDYLNRQRIAYRFSDRTNSLEVDTISQEQKQEIVDNFDIIKSVTSTLATVIRPNRLNLPERTYGFEVAPLDDNIPIIGILDTGIENDTPLSSILIQDDSYNITSSAALSDTASGGSGHGTAVAALAAMGRRPYTQQYRGLIHADARLLSMKIIDNNVGSVSHMAVLSLLKRAHDERGVKIFVLTVCYDTNKKSNEAFSAYAYELDKFAHEYGCLVFICTSNNNNAQAVNSNYDFNYFGHDDVNLSVPAESMNNVTVGASADCLRGGLFMGASPQKEFPTMYSRKGHIDLSVFNRKKNPHYFKPDIVECGGDYEVRDGFMGTGENASMEVLSANSTESFYTDVGTSFSAPLAANIAAQIWGKYPSLEPQSVKALIINAASLENIRFNGHENMLNRMAGYGHADPLKSVESDDNRITFLVEDTINPEEFKSYPICLPQYLYAAGQNRNRRIVTINATLCFSFNPVLNNQLSYNPVHMAFSFFRNHDGDTIQEVSRITNSKLKNTMTWTQNGRNISNPVPYSNVQKITFPVNLNELTEENGTFKLAIHCRVSHQILETIRREYEHPHPFSIVVTVENNLTQTEFSGRLYNEMVAINNFENIVESIADSDISVEL